MEREISRRDFLKCLALLPLAVKEVSGAWERTSENWVTVSRKQGETLLSLCSFHNVEPEDYKRALVRNRGLGAGKSFLELPITPKKLQLPITRIEIPAFGLNMGVTLWSPDWEEEGVMGGTFLAYLAEPPYFYTLLGHSDEKKGPFFSLREIKMGEPVFLCKDWSAGKGNWIETKTTGKYWLKNLRDFWEILENNAKSYTPCLATCLPEQGPEGRLVVALEVLDWSSHPKLLFFG